MIFAIGKKQISDFQSVLVILLVSFKANINTYQFQFDLPTIEMKQQSDLDQIGYCIIPNLFTFLTKLNLINYSLMQKIVQRAVWSPNSYINFKKYIDYFNHEDPVFAKLASMPNIVKPEKVHRTKEYIKKCQQRKATLLHTGDCAEPFQHAEQTILHQKVEFFKACRDALSAKKNKPAYLIGRVAGQYAKPRSSEYMIKDGVQIHNYKGDNVNSIHEHERDPCENRLFKGYLNSVKVAKFIQIHFPQMSISHQGLILPYQAALTRQVYNEHFCLSAHMIWIGERTRQLDGAHVEFFRGIANPIGVKVSSNIKEQEFLELVKTLNPKNQMGKLMVITRMGKDKIKGNIEKLIKVKKNEGLNFLFVTDPMHGNTFQSKQSKLKTRNVEHILQEIQYVEQKMNQNNLGCGFSLQSTFQKDATECFGIEFPHKESQLMRQKFTSKCDPRLNHNQALKVIEKLCSH